MRGVKKTFHEAARRSGEQGVRGKGNDTRSKGEEEEINVEKINRVIGRLKNGKAAGMESG